jgi:hypothetical protein
MPGPNMKDLDALSVEYVVERVTSIGRPDRMMAFESRADRW